MIVPRTRLLALAAFIILPLLTFMVATPVIAPFCLLGLLAVTLVTVLDVLRGLNRSRQLQVEMPELTRMTKDRDAELEIILKLPEGHVDIVDLGLQLPPEFHVPELVRTIQVPDGAQKLRLRYAIRPLMRGNFRVRACYLEVGTPWNLWGLRQTLELNTEIRVYPNLMPERRNLAALFLNRGNFGIHAQRQVGKGRDFEKLRAYLPGDPVEDIHWKATAKRNEPVTKVFQIERTQEVYVIIDSSRLSARTVRMPTEDGMDSLTTELERFVSAALIMGLVAERQGDLFGVMSFSDTVNRFIRARNGRGHYGACRDALYALQPSPHTPDFNEVCSYIRMNLRRRALLIFLTNLDDPVMAENFEQNINLISRHHLVLVNMLQPASARPLFSNPELHSVDEIYAELGGHHRWQTLREVQSTLRRRGVEFRLLENEKMTADIVSQYLNVKQRQLI